MPLDLAEAICGSEAAASGCCFAGLRLCRRHRTRRHRVGRSRHGTGGSSRRCGCRRWSGAGGGCRSRGARIHFRLLALAGLLGRGWVVSVWLPWLLEPQSPEQRPACAVVASAAAFLLLRVFLVPVSPAVVDVSEAAGAAASAAAVFFFLVFLAGVDVSAVVVSEAAAALRQRHAVFLLLRGFLGRGGRSVCRCRRWLIAGSGAASSSSSSFSSWWLWWKSGRPWNSPAVRAMAEIPVSTNNMQSAIVHILSLFCSLLMISSLVPGPAAINCGSFPQGRRGVPGGPSRGDHDDTSTMGSTQGIPDMSGRRLRPPLLLLTLRLMFRLQDSFAGTASW